MPDRAEGAIALPEDLTQWLIAKAVAVHAGSYGAALEQVLREAKAREDGAAFTADRVSRPSDPWEQITAEARHRHGK